MKATKEKAKKVEKVQVTEVPEEVVVIETPEENKEPEVKTQEDLAVVDNTPEEDKELQEDLSPMDMMRLWGRKMHDLAHGRFKVYVLTCRFMNGTVTMFTDSSVFATKELAEKTEKEVIRQNKPTPIISEIKECIVYETADQVPIFKERTE